MSFICVSVEKSTERHVGLWFVRSPEPIVAPPGDEVVFECSLNVGSESVRWKHNAEYLPPDSSGPTSHNTARPLPATNRLVKVLDERQAGDYQVRATPDHLLFTCLTQHLFCCCLFCSYRFTSSPVAMKFGMQQLFTKVNLCHLLEFQIQFCFMIVAIYLKWWL